MKPIEDYHYFDLKYQNNEFKNLEFIRIDQICEVFYITFKNPVTEEMYTFKEKSIHSFQISNQWHNGLAEMDSYSLY